MGAFREIASAARINNSYTSSLKGGGVLGGLVGKSTTSHAQIGVIQSPSQTPTGLLTVASSDSLKLSIIKYFRLNGSLLQERNNEPGVQLILCLVDLELWQKCKKEESGQRVSMCCH